MSKQHLIKRSLAAGLAIGAAGFPAAAQAMFIQGPSGPVPSQSTHLASVPALRGSSAQSGFRWGDAGIGAAGTVVLLGAGAGAASAVRRRRAERVVTG